jgi:hypothetical protein
MCRAPVVDKSREGWGDNRRSALPSWTQAHLLSPQVMPWVSDPTLPITLALFFLEERDEPF